MTPTLRQEHMRLLARAPAERLQAVLDELETQPAFSFLKEPEVTSIMVEGRAGGTGGAFNLGEATVTRCVIELSASKSQGFAYALGRDKQHAEQSALLEALFQLPDHASLRETFVTSETALQDEDVERRRKQAAATKVDFFTMVRGD